MKFSPAILLMTLATSAGAVFGDVADYTRTVVAENYHGHEGMTFVKYEKLGEKPYGRAWLLKFDLSKGYRLRTFFGDGNGGKATVGEMAALIEAGGQVPLCGLNADYFIAAEERANPSGVTISESRLEAIGYGDKDLSHIALIETADGMIVHGSNITARTDGKTSGAIAHSYDVLCNGKKIRNAVRTGNCNYPVHDGRIYNIGNKQSRTEYPRSLVGLGRTDEGNPMLVLFLNDGRQEEWSLGVTDVDSAQMLIDEGCTEVGEFDGGGSASLWLKDCENPPQTKGYVNRPSDGAPRRVASGVFVLAPTDRPEPVAIGDDRYYDFDEAAFAVAPGETIALLDAAEWTAADALATSCTVVSFAADPASTPLACAQPPTVAAGATVLFSNVVFGAGSRALTVSAGGTAAVAGLVGLEGVVTADATGFALAGALTAPVVVSCAAASAAGEAFGTCGLPSDAAAASLPLVRNGANPWLSAQLADGLLVWGPGVGFGAVTTAEGWNFTGRTVSAAVSRVDVPVPDGVGIRLTVRTGDGTVVATRTSPFTGVGSYAFDTAEAGTLVPGTQYEYEIRLVDAKGAAVADVPPVSGTFAAAGTVEWMTADAATGTERGGQWAVRPEVVADAYALTNVHGSAFRAQTPADGIVRVTSTLVFPAGRIREVLNKELEGFAADAPWGALSIRETEDGRLVWVGLMRENGKPVYRDLTGPAPELGKGVLCAIEADVSSSPPRVTYRIGDAETPLADAVGRTWFESARSAPGTARAAVYCGRGSLASLVGSRSDVALVEVDGVRYADLAAAFAASGGKPVRLLTNVAIDLGTVGAGTYGVTADGRGLRWTDNGRYAVYDGASETLTVKADGAPANGLDSYTSAMLNLDAEDPDSKPIALLAPGAEPGSMKITMALANGKPFEPRVQVRYALESSDSVDFKSSDVTAPCATAAFDIPSDAGPGRFFRIHIIF